MLEELAVVASLGGIDKYCTTVFGVDYCGTYDYIPTMYGESYNTVI